MTKKDAKDITVRLTRVVRASKDEIINELDRDSSRAVVKELILMIEPGAYSLD